MTIFFETETEKDIRNGITFHTLNTENRNYNIYFEFNVLYILLNILNILVVYIR